MIRINGSNLPATATREPASRTLPAPAVRAWSAKSRGLPADHLHLGHHLARGPASPQRRGFQAWPERGKGTRHSSPGGRITAWGKCSLIGSIMKNERRPQKLEPPKVWAILGLNQ
jgi:hypothetical protein